MSRFIEYCEEIEKARKQGFGRVVLPAAISLPDICGRIEYSGSKYCGTRKDCEDKSTQKYYWYTDDGRIKYADGKIYKQWAKNFLKGICPIEATITCLNCHNQNPEINVCKDDCPTQDSAYIDGMEHLADRLYGLRNNLTHEGDMKGEHYLFDMAYSDAEYPIQSQSFVNGRWQFGKSVVNLGVLIHSLCVNAIEYYNKVDADKKMQLDTFDKEVFHSDDMNESLQRMQKVL